MKEYLIYAIPIIIVLLLWACKTAKLRKYIRYAKKGNVLAQEALGNHYYRAKRTRRNRRKALKWFLMAAENGSTKVFPAIGNIYYYGTGVKANIKEALKWYLPAAEAGDALSQFQCGFIYRNGAGGVPKNDYEAFKWYSLAAPQGDAKAQLQLGLCYLSGEGTEKDIDKATEWLKKSKEQGNESAAELLDMIPLYYRNLKT